MSLAKVENWEAMLHAAFDRVDAYLEKKHGHRFTRKPNRPAHGDGPTRDSDGLFDLTVGFTAGFGSIYGQGYVFKIRLATFDPIPPDICEMLKIETIKALSQELAVVFPERDLRIVVDGDQYKIIGDLSLG